MVLLNSCTCAGDGSFHERESLWVMMDTEEATENLLAPLRDLGGPWKRQYIEHRDILCDNYLNCTYY